MPQSFEKERFVKCYKYGFNFYVYETYIEIDNTEMAELKSTLCPAISRGQGYDSYHCNGMTEYGTPCSYAADKKKSPVPFPDKK